jgi:hypothetical protein
MQEEENKTVYENSDDDTFQEQVTLEEEQMWKALCDDLIQEIRKLGSTRKSRRYIATLKGQEIKKKPRGRPRKQAKKE